MPPGMVDTIGTGETRGASEKRKGEKDNERIYRTGTTPDDAGNVIQLEEGKKMKRTFVKETLNDWREILQVNEETEEVKIYCQEKEIGFPFSEYYTTVKDMGWKSVKEFLMWETDIKDEVDTQAQEESEIKGLHNLREYRLQHGKSGLMQLKDGTIYDDIAERLKAYKTA